MRRGSRDAWIFDARMVRVLDFERALEGLAEEEQMLLGVSYRERRRQEEVCKILHWSVRKAA